MRDQNLMSLAEAVGVFEKRWRFPDWYFDLLSGALLGLMAVSCLSEVAS